MATGKILKRLAVHRFHWWVVRAVTRVGSCGFACTEHGGESWASTVPEFVSDPSEESAIYSQQPVVQQVQIQVAHSARKPALGVECGDVRGAGQSTAVQPVRGPSARLQCEGQGAEDPQVRACQQVKGRRGLDGLPLGCREGSARRADGADQGRHGTHTASPEASAEHHDHMASESTDSLRSAIGAAHQDDGRGDGERL